MQRSNSCGVVVSLILWYLPLFLIMIGKDAEMKYAPLTIYC
nr:MAG TPA: hypothetical protein [Caudoviricetes sp.]